jgi:hypothetical protein
MRVSDLHRRVIASSRPNLLTDLVAYWNMDGNGIDIINGFAPTFQSQVTYNNDSILGTSASGNAGFSIIRYADNNDFSFTDATSDLPFSWSCWVYFTGFSSTGNWLINKRAGPPNAEYQLNYSITSNRISFTKYNLGGTTITQNVQTQPSLISLNTWYHLVVTDKGTADFNDVQIYLNGVNVVDIRQNIGGTYTKMSNGTSDLGLIGFTFSTGDTTRHRGRLDEVAIWKNRELTPAEVTYLYNSGLGRTYPL